MHPDDETLRIHAFLPASRANGPGLRAVIWSQGCSFKCGGCFNPETHTINAGERISITDLVARIQASTAPIEGVTLSGGEPLQQPAATMALLRRLRAETHLSTLLFTGYSWQEVQQMPLAAELPQLLDVVIAGRYEASQRVATGLIGSANKHVEFFTDRYTMADLAVVPVAEVRITADGHRIMSGIEPLRFNARGLIE